MSTIRRLHAVVRPLDVAAVLAVPAVLLLVFALPATTRESLALSAASPTVVSAYTAHLVHLTPGHLIGNLAVYAIAVPPAYLLAVLGDSRRAFLTPFVGVLVSFPFVLSALYLLLGGGGRVLGFSGLNMAFVGMVPLFETVYLSRLDGGVRLDHAPAFFFAGAAVIAVKVVPGGLVRTALALGAALVALAYAAYAYRGLAGGTFRDLAGRPGGFELAAGAAVVFFAAVFVAFPANPVRSAGVVDVYTHFLGYALGFVSTYLLLRTDDPTDRIPDPPADTSE